MGKHTEKSQIVMIKPTITQIKEALEKSGYLLEQKICPIIERHGFLTTPNEQYQDQDTGKSREIDIHAARLASLYRNDYDDTFESSLLIECKNNSTPVIFFTQKNPIPKSIFGYVIINGYPDGIYEKGLEEAISIEDYFHFEKFHHNYNSEYIARQFCQMKPKVIGKGSQKETIEWDVYHEGLYESIDSLVRASAYYESELRSSIIIDEESKDLIHLGIIYPILLFSGPIFECRIVGKGYKLYQTKHLTFYKEIQSKTLEGTYHIDVISEGYISRFLKIINEETDKIISRLKRKRSLLKSNAKQDFIIKKGSKENGAVSDFKS